MIAYFTIQRVRFPLNPDVAEATRGKYKVMSFCFTCEEPKLFVEIVNA